MYLISTTHSSLISSSFYSLFPYLSSTPRIPDCHAVLGNITGGCFAFAPLADFLKVLLITTWSPSSALLAEIRIIIPSDALGERSAMILFTAIRDRSERKQTLYTESRIIHFFRYFSHLYTVLLPSVLALMLSRYYPWERTCNAGMWFSMYTPGNSPFTYIADEIHYFFFTI